MMGTHTMIAKTKRSFKVFIIYSVLFFLCLVLIRCQNLVKIVTYSFVAWSTIIQSKLLESNELFTDEYYKKKYKQ
jgi:hypothetical protein